VILSVLLALAVPTHVNTADYWGGYAGTKVVAASDAALWLNWVETDASASLRIAPLGVRAIAYSNPNRIQPTDGLYRGSADRFARTCSGAMVRTSGSYAGQVLTDPRSAQLAQDWRTGILDQRGEYDAVFDDDAVGAAYAPDSPCNYRLDDWLSDEAQLIARLGLPVIYNGLNDFHDRGLATEIALNRVAIGGMMEECYAQLETPHEVGGWEWSATEATELRMAADRKWFFCYGRDLTPAPQAVQSRLYTDASFLLTYDPRSSVLWEYYATSTGAHVMPESELVPADPVRASVTSIDQLRRNGGAYVREYRECYIDARPQGPCAAMVNPDATAPATLDVRGYTRSLQLVGSGTFDGGRVAVVRGGVPAELGPLQAVIAFR
jgi:hypothetical protein